MVLRGAIEWISAALAAGYLLTAVLTVGSRIRYERRRRILARLEAAVSTGGADDIGDISTSIVMALLAESQHAGVQRLLAACVVERLGGDWVRRTARTPTGRRGGWHRVAALRVVALTRPAGWTHSMAQALADGTPEVGAAVTAMLGQMDDPSAAVLLIQALEEGRHPRARIATALEAFPGSIERLLTPLLAAAQPEVRYWAALLMRRYPRAAGLDSALAALTRDQSAFVRKAAVDTLSVVGGPAAGTAVEALLHDEAPFVRAQAARTLGTLGARDRVEAVLPLLADTHWFVRAAAKQSLEAMGAEASGPILGYLAHPDAFARNGAAEVLQNLGTFERMLVEERTGPSMPDHAAALRLLAEAGGGRMRDIVLTRLPAAARPRARQLLSEIRPTPEPDNRKV